MVCFQHFPPTLYPTTPPLPSPSLLCPSPTLYPTIPLLPSPSLLCPSPTLYPTIPLLPSSAPLLPSIPPSLSFPLLPSSAPLLPSIPPSLSFPLLPSIPPDLSPSLHPLPPVSLFFLSHSFHHPSLSLTLSLPQFSLLSVSSGPQCGVESVYMPYLCIILGMSYCLQIHFS